MLLTFVLTHWGRVTHISVSQLIIIVSDNGLSLDRRQAIIWINDGQLSFGPLGRIFSEIVIEIYIFSFKKMHLKISSGKWRPFCLGLNVLKGPINNMSALIRKMGCNQQTENKTQPADWDSTRFQKGLCWCHYLLHAEVIIVRPCGCKQTETLNLNFAPCIHVLNLDLIFAKMWNISFSSQTNFCQIVAFVHVYLQ